MFKKNFIGIIMVILLIGAFGAGYWLGKSSSGPAPSQQAAAPEQKSKTKPTPSDAEQTAKSSSPTAAADEDQSKKPTSPDSAASTQKQPKTPPESAQAAPTPAIGQTFYGTVVPYDEANVQSTQGGAITMLKAREGDLVKRGELLVRFDDSDMRLELEKAESSRNSALQQVQQAESNFNTIQTNVKRTQELFDNGMVSKQELDTIVNQLDSARASLNSAKEGVTREETQINIIKNNLKDFQVAASLSGIVESKHYNIGEVYQGGGVIYHLINIDRVYVEVEVPETYIPKVKENMKVGVTFDALGEQKFSGSVEKILPSGTSDNRNFTAKVLVSNSDHAIKPGMFARIDIAIEK